MFGCSVKSHDWQGFQAYDSITSVLRASTGTQQVPTSKQPEGVVVHAICTGQLLATGHSQN